MSPHLVGVGEWICACPEGHSGECIPLVLEHTEIREGDPRYNLVQEILEGDARMQDAAALRLSTVDKLIQDAQDVAESLTKALVPEDLRAAGYRFVFDTTPMSFKAEEGS